MIPTWLISGGLGSGKTTTVQQLLRKKPAYEHWALLINDFGAVGLDAALLANQGATVHAVEGGCACCSGAGALEAALQEAMNHAPDRLLIEPSGMSVADVLVDTLLRHEGIELHGVIYVLDAAHADPQELIRWQSVLNQLTLADLVLLNKTDLAPPGRCDALERVLDSLYPPKTVLRTQNGTLDLATLEALQPYRGPRFMPPAAPHQHGGAVTTTTLQNWPHGGEKRIQQGISASTGWLWPPETAFDWRGAKRLLEKVGDPPYGDVQRLKAVLHIGEGRWMAFQWMHGQLTRELSSWRRDSRLEIIHGASFDTSAFEQALRQTCIR
ncbi:GTPase, G3E family [Sulfurivirga caldicuralii]|uniref:GTPase, G3E family n=1 Tax=Sulfurivirga caldicuralii TaxID=364032 RepID=A0A1N6GMW0_9GAMM|nr:GTP-binding protein [Sulfurivirga caldicuralii]SIO08791.1 GTPase, G3E family [Sulfurivirga caldicuralii]